jgi:hypothetical protein
VSRSGPSIWVAASDKTTKALPVSSHGAAGLAAKMTAIKAVNAKMAAVTIARSPDPTFAAAGASPSPERALW